MITPELSTAVAFERAVAEVLKHEGGGKFHWDRQDPGGATKFGISLRFAGSVNLDIDGDGKTTGEDIRALTRPQAVGLYRKHFWLPLACDRLKDPGLALMVFDGGVNQGVRTMAKRLQRAVGAVDDGVIGPKTLESVALWQAHMPALIGKVGARRAKRYAETRNFKRYGLGWMMRLFEVYQEALKPWAP